MTRQILVAGACGFQHGVALSIYHLYNWLQPGFRQRRMRLFLDLFQPTAKMRILDVGGYPSNWENIKEVTSRITFLNLAYPHGPRPNPRFDCIVGDGRKLDFPDQAFDIVFSNSVIEHVGGLADQQQFASEVRRVGRQIFVQTPNRRFPIEPHFGAFMIHLLPWPLARYLLCHFSFRAWFRKGDNLDLRQAANELRLLTCHNMRELFPDCEIHREKLWGLTKSLIAVNVENGTNRTKGRN